MSAAAEPVTKIPERSEIEARHTWDLDVMFPTSADWEADFDRVDGLIEPILALRGKLTSSAALRTLFEAEDTLGLLLERLHTYAHHREDENTTNADSQARMARVRARYADVMGKTAWTSPEILSQPLETLEAWRDSPELAQYRYAMTQLIRRKPHTLSDKEETLLSMAAEVFGAPGNIFGFLTNADMKFANVTDEKGQPQPLSNGRFVPFMENRDRAVRRRAFETFYDTYIGYENTLASTLATGVKVHNYGATVHNYGSALEASLHSDNIPVPLYDSLIKAVHEALPAFHEYVALRKEVLGVDELNMWDAYVPIVPDFDVKVEWDEALQWVRESIAPLGADYAAGVDEAFTKRWIDVYENKGKRSGAYSGGCYGSPSYMLMNYQGTLDWVFTLAHELGHSMHSWLANRAQKYRDASYTIFVAEIASTTNEALLHHYLLGKTDDPRMKAYLLNHLCDQFRGTVYRQTMFAEFEKSIHERDAAGEPLTAASLSDSYYELNAKYYGPLINADRRISHEWSRIPHFYYNFYVYKYATGFCASQLFYKRILEGGDSRDQYIRFLQSGGSADPLDLVRAGGVDLTDPKVLTSAFATFRESVAELRKLIVK